MTATPVDEAGAFSLHLNLVNRGPLTIRVLEVNLHAPDIRVDRVVAGGRRSSRPFEATVLAPAEHQSVTVFAHVTALGHVRGCNPDQKIGQEAFLLTARTSAGLTRTIHPLIRLLRYGEVSALNLEPVSSGQSC